MKTITPASIISKKANWQTLKQIINNMHNIPKLITKKSLLNVDSHDLVIRWGLATTLPPQLGEVTANRPGPICRAANKLQARKILLEKGIAAPKIGDNMPCIARKIQHRKGKSFVFCTETKHLARAKRLGLTYFQEYIPKEREYRVHVVGHGKGVIVVQEKIDILDHRLKEAINWNHTNGFSFQVVPWSKIPRGLCGLAGEACEALELNFGAVDIIESKNQFYVLEINTAPGVEGYTAERYGLYFDYIIDFFNEHKELPIFERRKKFMLREQELKYDF